MFNAMKVIVIGYLKLSFLVIFLPVIIIRYYLKDQTCCQVFYNFCWKNNRNQWKTRLNL